MNCQSLGSIGTSHDLSRNPAFQHWGALQTVTATGSADKTKKVWDVITGKEIAALEGHTGHVETVAFGVSDSRI